MKRLVTFFIYFFFFVLSLRSERESENIHSILCLASEDLATQELDRIDPKALTAYLEQGFDLKFDFYQRITAEKLRRYPLIIGMTPMLHAGTRAIDEKRGNVLKSYIQEGGAFLLIPGPSYYGGATFHKELNPWLVNFGVALLNEQPRDTQNQKTRIRLLNYRYLRTSNFYTHPVTEGLAELWLPIDFTDSYLRTHTMQCDSNWTVVVRGETTCKTYLYDDLVRGKNTPGTYDKAPPFLAFREWGHGKIAIFTTASGYYIFDAYHWAYGNGFVMKEGLQLMCQLFRELINPAFETAPEKKLDSALVPGNVKIEPDKIRWMDYVIKEHCPDGFAVHSYIDCGSIYDLPYSEKRGRGYLEKTSWPIRWNWSEQFHATGSNSRGFDIKPLRYRLDGIDPSKQYKLGIMLWGYQDEGARSVRVTLNGKAKRDGIKLPRFSQGEGPRFLLLDAPDTLSSNTLECVFERGKGKGSFSSLCELWLFESGEKEQRAENLRQQFEKLGEVCADIPTRMQAYHGLIGAVPRIEGNKVEVKNLCDAAKAEGLDFLVFINDIEQLTPKTYEVYKKSCANASNSDFTAWPGLRFSDRYENRARRKDDPQSWGEIKAYVFQGLEQLPSKKIFGNPYTSFWKFYGGEFSGGRSCIPNILESNSKDISPFFQRFWRGINVASKTDKRWNRDIYVDLLSSGYGPRPRAYSVFKSSEELKKGFHEGWFVTLFSPSREALLAHTYTSCISNGPRLERCSFSFNHSRGDPPGSGLIFNEKDWVIFQLKANAKTPFSKVTLYSGLRPLRVWRPAVSELDLEEIFQVARTHELWVHLVTTGGCEAISGRFQALENTFPLGMCADNQNTICNLTVPPTSFVRDDRELYLAHSYWHTGEAAGQLGAMIKSTRYVPRVIETGIIQPVKFFKPAPRIKFPDGSFEDHSSGKMRIRHASSDHNQIEYYFDTPQSLARSITRLNAFRPVMEGHTMLLVESELLAKTNLLEKKAMRIDWLQMALLPYFPENWKCTYSTETELKTQSFSAQTDSEILSTDGGVLVWGNEIASLIVIPLLANPLMLDIKKLSHWNGREYIGLHEYRHSFFVGQPLQSRFLLGLYRGKINKPEELMEIIARYKSFGKAIDTLLTGKRLDGFYPIPLQAQNFAVSGTLLEESFQNPLPIRIEGISPNWSCVLKRGNRWRILEAASSMLYTVIDPGKHGPDFFIGNPVISSHDTLHLEWVGITEGKIQLHAHNPTDQDIHATLRTNPALKDIPHAENTIRLRPGQSSWLKL